MAVGCSCSRVVTRPLNGGDESCGALTAVCRAAPPDDCSSEFTLPVGERTEPSLVPQPRKACHAAHGSETPGTGETTGNPVMCLPAQGSLKSKGSSWSAWDAAVEKEAQLNGCEVLLSRPRGLQWTGHLAPAFRMDFVAWNLPTCIPRCSARKRRRLHQSAYWLWTCGIAAISASWRPWQNDDAKANQEGHGYITA